MTGPAHDRMVRIARSAEASLEEEVRRGLFGPRRRLPFSLLYDAVGSELFRRITEQPEYYLPRAETEILEAAAPEVAAACPERTTIVELGAGHAVRTPILIDAFRAAHGRTAYVPIDISGSALKATRKDLLARYADLPVLAIEAEYFDALARLPLLVPAPRLFLWLGSNIGNFAPGAAADFLGVVRSFLEPTDALLLGVDLPKKVEILRAAYDDAAGWTARFIGNALERINRELGADFSSDGFFYRVDVAEDGSCVTMSLVSRGQQTVHIPGLGDLTFDAGEAIHVEDSHKLSPLQVDAVLDRAGFAAARTWSDARERFAVVLARPVAAGEEDGS